MKSSTSPLLSQINHTIDFKTKPLGALGLLEDIARQVCSVQNTVSPRLKKPHILVFAGDHGITQEGVSAYPSEVTYQMVLNFVQGGAGINVFAHQHNIDLTVVDAGVNHDFDPQLPIIHHKVNYGTENFAKSPAITIEELEKCFVYADELVNKLHQNGTNILGFGEMGIGNTSSATMLMHKLLDLPLEYCVGRGTGIDDQTLTRKLHTLQQASDTFNTQGNPLETLRTFGGFEIAMMSRSMLTAAKLGMLILIDGFIATSAFLGAVQLDNSIQKNAVFCHQSDEKGHRLMLKKLKVRPILHLSLRLGEGTGCALAFPLIQSAVNFMNEMASFDDLNDLGATN